MANRVTFEEVKTIIELDASVSDAMIDAFIGSAHALVELKLAGSTLSETVKKQIELYIAAHLCSLRDQRRQSEGVGGASVSYQGQTAMMLKSTYYGQTACLFDTTGTLAALGGATASVETILWNDHA